MTSDESAPGSVGALLWKAPAPERAAVYELGPIRWLEFGHGTVQTRVDTSAPERLLLPYTQALASVLLLAPAPRSALLLGLGGGALAHFLLHHLDDLVVDAVDASPAVIEAARTYFALPRSPRLRVECADARAVLDREGRAYDLVVVDVFEETGLPPWVLEPALYRRLRAHVGSSAALAVNLWVDDAQTFLAAVGGVRAAFDGHVLVLPVPGFRNLAVLALGDAPAELELETLRRRAERWAARTGIDFPTFVEELEAANATADGMLLL